MNHDDVDTALRTKYLAEYKTNMLALSALLLMMGSIVLSDSLNGLPFPMLFVGLLHFPLGIFAFMQKPWINIPIVGLVLAEYGWLLSVYLRNAPEILISMERDSFSIYLLCGCGFHAMILGTLVATPIRNLRLLSLVDKLEQKLPQPPEPDTTP